MEFDFLKQPGRKLDADLDTRKGTYQGKTRLSIITPFYNAGKYFDQTCRSVMRQTFPWFEWIIVDDGSDHAEDIAMLEKLPLKDRRIHVIRQENKGLANARNAGIAMAQTDMIVPLDADDLISPQYLEYVFFGLYYNPDADWCYTDSVGFGKQHYLWKHSWDAKKLKSYNFLLATAAIRKPAIEEIGGYKAEKWPYYEDWRFWLEMLTKHKKPVHLKGYLFWYRRLENGMLSGIKKDKEREQFCKRIIKEAGRYADTKIRAIEYPLYHTQKPYYKIRRLEFWDSYRVSADNGKIKVLMLIPWMVMGGADQFNLDLVAGLSRDKFQLCIISTVPSENEWQQKFAQYTDEIFNLPEFLDPAYYAEFVAYFIQTRQIDILLVSNSCRGYYMLPWLRKQFDTLCIVDYVHMEEWYWKAGGFARLSGIFGSVLEKTYVCNSATGQVLVDHFGRDSDSVHTVHIGVDKDKFDRSKVAPGCLYRRLGIRTKRPIILFPCRITPQKRPFLLLEIAKKVRKVKPEALFVVVGDGEQLTSLIAAIKQKHLERQIMCIGRSDDMAACYRDAKITLICSIKEGLALTAYESCAMGVPVVSSDVGGQSDLIDHSVGALVPMRQEEGGDFDTRKFSRQEVSDYAAAILKLLSDQEFYHQCSINCRKKIEDRFSTEVMLKKMEKEFLSLVKDAGWINQRREMAAAIKEMGNIPEELYTMELAEEGRSGEVGAVTGFISRVSRKILPVNSRRREMAIRIYRKFR